MSWLFQLQTTNPVAHAVAVLTLACTAGMALGIGLTLFRARHLPAAAGFFAALRQQRMRMDALAAEIGASKV